MDKELQLFLKNRCIYMNEYNLHYEKINCKYLYQSLINFNIDTKLNFKNFKKYLDEFIISINDKNIIDVIKTSKLKKHKYYCINYNSLKNYLCY